MALGMLAVKLPPEQSQQPETLLSLQLATAPFSHPVFNKLCELLAPGVLRFAFGSEDNGVTFEVTPVKRPVWGRDHTMERLGLEGTSVTIPFHGQGQDARRPLPPPSSVAPTGIAPRGQLPEVPAGTEEAMTDKEGPQGGVRRVGRHNPFTGAAPGVAGRCP